MATAEEDDEFGDEIDWSAVPLPSASASSGAAPRRDDAAFVGGRTASVGGGGVGGGGGGGRHWTSSSGSFPAREYDGSGANRTRTSTGSTGVAPSSSRGDVDALRRQIQDLQSALSRKDDRIFELEASSAASAAEATHRAKRAEGEATSRISRAEEEVRRTREEAEKYRGCWMRARRRAGELEGRGGAAAGGAETASGAAGGGGGDKVGGGTGLGGGAVAAWGGRSPDATSRKVTPRANDVDDGRDRRRPLAATDESGGDDSPAAEKRAGGGEKKRKAPGAAGGDLRAVDAGEDRTEPRTERPIDAGRSSALAVASARQRLAGHLMTRDEMGCYSFSDGRDADATSSPSRPKDGVSMDVDDDDGARRRAEADDAAPRPASDDADAAEPSLFAEAEVRRFVASLLRQMAEVADDSAGPGAPTVDALSSSGLVHVLVLRFNSLFRRWEDERALDCDGDGDRVASKEDDATPIGDEGRRTGRQMVLVPSSAATNENQNSTELAPCAAVSWRAALYLLRVLRDVLLLSGTVREDLRWWLYRSRQSAGNGGGGRADGGSPGADRRAAEGATDVDDGNVAHPRIEGLPPAYQRKRTGSDRREVFGTAHRFHDPGERSHAWDPATMVEPCNLFFELLTALMKGNVFERLNGGDLKEARLEGTERTLHHTIQLEAIDLTLALMSDAPPYDHARGGWDNRTPYLWKFWFDALLPSHSSARTEKYRGGPESSPVGDFFSPWEEVGGDGRRLLGSGRKHATRLLVDKAKGGNRPPKQSSEKPSRPAGRRSTPAPQAPRERSKKAGVSQQGGDEKQHDRLPALIKSRILHFLSHFMHRSSSVRQSMRQPAGKGETPLAKRILAAVLDEVEERVVPCLSSWPSSDRPSRDVEACLELCIPCIRFLVDMARSNEGIRMLRVQMRLESEPGEASRWSQSAIGCVTSMLDSALSCAFRMEEKETIPFDFACLSHVNIVVDQCVVFFKAILLFVNQQRDSSTKAATFLALVAEHRTIFQSCCHRILARQSNNVIMDRPRLLHLSEGLKDDVRGLIEELMIDEEEGNRNG